MDLKKAVGRKSRSDVERLRLNTDFLRISELTRLKVSSWLRFFLSGESIQVVV